ncbi:MAG: hypothetical protein LM522_06830, partial [Candidatus Contendobacter sp.]|nr:hypothetical protein [Candidatus Contendobacter sp.]
AATLLEQIRQFHEKALGIVDDETKAWAAEFTEVLQQLDEQVKTDRSNQLASASEPPKLSAQQETR